MRAVFGIFLILAAVVTAGCAASSTNAAAAMVPQQQAAWAMYQHSPDRNAVFTQYRLTRDWSYDAKAKINSGLALVGNTLLFTTFSKKVVALDLRDGHVLWQANLPNIAMSTPIVAGNMVYVGTGRDGPLDRGLRKHFSVQNVLLKLRYGNAALAGTIGGDQIAAFDLRTGARRWIHPTLGQDMPSALYDHGRLIFANGDWHAYALRADTGQQLWSTLLGGNSMMASAVSAGNLSIVAVCTRTQTANFTIALDPATGKIVWRSPYGHCDASPAYADGKVFVSAPDRSPVNPSILRSGIVVAALDAKTGTPVWKYRGNKRGFFTRVSSGEIAVAGTYAGGTYYQSAPFTDQLIAFDAATGKVRWTFDTVAPVKMSPVIANGRLYVGDLVGLLYTLDARTGKALEVRGFHEPFTVSPPIIAGNKLIVANGTSVNVLPLSGVVGDLRYNDHTGADEAAHN